MTVVDLHSHFFPETWPDLAERFGTPDWPWMRRDGPDHAMVMLGRSEFRPITSACWDASVRLADMDRDGIDASVLFPNKGLAMWATPDPVFAMAQCRVYNDWAWETGSRPGSIRST